MRYYLNKCFYLATCLLTMASVCPGVLGDSVNVIGFPTPTPGVAGLWLFDEGPDQADNWSIVDQSCRGNHGVNEPISAVNPVYIADTPFLYSGNFPLKNYALDFGTGSSAHVEIPDSESLDLTGNFTVETWVNLNTLLGVDQYLVSKRGLPGSSSGYILEWAGDSQTFQFTVGTSAGYQSVISQGFTPTTGQWIHLAGVHDTAAGKLRLYINGQLNNSASAEAVVNTNNDPLWLGNWAAGGKPANAKLDEVRISSTALAPNQLSYCHSIGPAKMVFADAIETYTDESDLWSRGGPLLNQWRRTPPASGGSINYLSNSHSRSGTHSIDINIQGDQNSPYSTAYLYYRFPLDLIYPVEHIGNEGWVSFENIDDARLFFLSEIFTGRIPPIEQYYGLDEALIAGGIQYNSRTNTWQYETLTGGYGYYDFSEPVTYQQGLDKFHYFKLIVNYKTRKYVSFQFDDRIWDLTPYDMLLFDPDTPHDPTPAMFEFNVRLITYDDYTGPFRCRAVVDDVAVTVEDGKQTGDSNKNGVVGALDMEVFTQHWLKNIWIN